MLTKDQFLDSILFEIDIMLHLHSKLPMDTLDYRPTEGQRSMLELLQYLSWSAIVPMRAAVEGNWDFIEDYREPAKSMSADEFPAAMGRQGEEIKELFEALSLDDLKNRQVTLPWGKPCTLAENFQTMGVKVFAAYRMMLFNYLKAVGVEGLDTFNCWMGADRPQKSA